MDPYCQDLQVLSFSCKSICPPTKNSPGNIAAVLQLALGYNNHSGSLHDNKARKESWGSPDYLKAPIINSTAPFYSIQLLQTSGSAIMWIKLIRTRLYFKYSFKDNCTELSRVIHRNVWKKIYYKNLTFVNLHKRTESKL